MLVANTVSDLASRAEWPSDAGPIGQHSADEHECEANFSFRVWNEIGNPPWRVSPVEQWWVSRCQISVEPQARCEECDRPAGDVDPVQLVHLNSFRKGGRPQDWRSDRWSSLCFNGRRLPRENRGPPHQGGAVMICLWPSVSRQIRFGYGTPVHRPLGLLRIS